MAAFIALPDGRQRIVPMRALGLGRLSSFARRSPQAGRDRSSKLRWVVYLARFEYFHLLFRGGFFVITSCMSSTQDLLLSLCSEILKLNALRRSPPTSSPASYTSICCSSISRASRRWAFGNNTTSWQLVRHYFSSESEIRS
jgi:hypothetical protein